MPRYKLRTLLIVATSVLTTAIAHNCSLCADEAATLKDLQRSQSVQHYLSRDAEPQWGESHRVLVVSWFFGKPQPRSVWRYEVNEKGQCYHGRDIYNNAMQHLSAWQMPDNELASLRRIVDTLPKSVAEPPIDRTVHVSFLAAGKWRTETYDSATLPDEWEAVLKIIGERFVTTDRHKNEQ